MFSACRSDQMDWPIDEFCQRDTKRRQHFHGCFVNLLLKNNPDDHLPMFDDLLMATLDEGYKLEEKGVHPHSLSLSGTRRLVHLNQLERSGEEIEDVFSFVSFL